MKDNIRVNISQSGDIVAARRAARMIAEKAGFGGSEQVMIVAAVSEITRNIIEHGGCRGSVTVRAVWSAARMGIEVIAADRGPGIAFPAAAMQQGYSTTHGLGLGLPAARRAFDEFKLQTALGAGTTVVMRKWGNGVTKASAGRPAVYFK